MKKVADKINEHPMQIVHIKDDLEIIELYGQKIELGHERNQIDDAKIDNLNEIFESKDKIAIISSKSQEVIYSYVDKVNEKISK